MPDVFIIYAREDEPVAQRLYDDLRKEGITPWIDSQDLLAGSNWRIEVTNAMRKSKYALIILSKKSVEKRGYVQTEVREALSILDTLPDSHIFIIPARVDECTPSHERLADLNWVDLYPSYDRGFRKIIKTIKRGKIVQKTSSICRANECQRSHKESLRSLPSKIKSAINDKAFSKSQRRVAPIDKNIVCPFCLRGTEIEIESLVTACKHCHQEMPALYVESYSQFPLCAIQVVGWPRHGKTAFQYAASMMLARLNIICAAYHFSPISERCRQDLKAVTRLQLTGEVPAATPPGEIETSVGLIENIEKWKGRLLVVKDTSGSFFESSLVDDKKDSFMMRVPTTFMVISLSDLALSDDLQSLEFLMINYLSLLLSCREANLARNLVIVLSKVDSILKDLPDDLRTYMLNDPIARHLTSTSALRGLTGITGRHRDIQALQVDDYVKVMQSCHEKIESWLGNSGKLINFMRQLRRAKIEARFALVSALGASPGNHDKLSSSWSPRRVLDPYFWAFEFGHRAAYQGDTGDANVVSTRRSD